MQAFVPLPDWNSQTWWWVGIGVYLLLSWLVVGPVCARWSYRSNRRQGATPKAAAECVPGIIIFAPLIPPFAVLFSLLFWVIMFPYYRFIFGKEDK